MFQLKNKVLTPKKKVPVRKNPSNSDHFDDDEALRQVSFSGSWMISYFPCQASVESLAYECAAVTLSFK